MSEVEPVKELLLQISKALVDYPEEVRVAMTERNNHVLLELTVHPDDVGKIIGRQGRIIKSIRMVVKTCALRDQKQISVELTNK